MKMKKKGYNWLLGLTILFTVAAILTVIPHGVAHKENMIGYKSMCSGAPVSTLILVICAGITCAIRKKKFTLK